MSSPFDVAPVSTAWKNLALPQQIAAMFNSSIPGVWYDPSDLLTMYQDLNGTRVTATGQSVAVILDKRLGLAQGSNLFANQSATFSNSAGGATVVTDAAARSANVTVAGTDDSYPRIRVNVGMTIGTFYYVSGQIVGWQSGDVVRLALTGTNNRVPINPLDGTFKGIIQSADATIEVYCDGRKAGLRTLNITEISPVAGNHAVQTTSGSRPIYRDVTYRYLEFDGVDDFLRSTFAIAQPIDRISALQQVTWTSGDLLFAGSGVASGSLFQITGTPRLDMSSGAALTLSPALAVGANGVITERHDGVSSRLALNAGADVSGDGGTTLPAGLTIGASAFGAAFANMFLHQLIMRGSTTAMTADQIAAARALCALKSGVTL